MEASSISAFLGLQESSFFFQPFDFVLSHRRWKINYLVTLWAFKPTQSLIDKVSHFWVEFSSPCKWGEEFESRFIELGENCVRAILFVMWENSPGSNLPRTGGLSMSFSSRGNSYLGRDQLPKESVLELGHEFDNNSLSQGSRARQQCLTLLLRLER